MGLNLSRNPGQSVDLFRDGKRLARVKVLEVNRFGAGRLRFQVIPSVDGITVEEPTHEVAPTIVRQGAEVIAVVKTVVNRETDPGSPLFGALYLDFDCPSSIRILRSEIVNRAPTPRSGAADDDAPPFGFVAPTRVVNVRGRSPESWANDPAFVYVGRAVPRAGWQHSWYANPYRVSMVRKSRNRVVTRYLEEVLDALAAAEAYEADPQLYEAPSLRIAFGVAWKHKLPELRGKALGCWCCDWSPGQPIAVPCHAIGLAVLADGGEEACRSLMRSDFGWPAASPIS